MPEQLMIPSPGMPHHLAVPGSAMSERHPLLDEDAFGEKSSTGGLRTFDAFPKTKPTYTRRSTTGGYTTILLIICSALLTFSEFKRWYAGAETQQFSVEKGVSHDLQINLDAVVAMRCQDLHVNVQDASGDRILAGEMLTREPTSWNLWVDPSRVHHSSVKKDRTSREDKEEEDTHVGHVLGEVRRGSKKFRKSPKMLPGMPEDSCRVFGSLEGNKVQGDFHITAKGHGYMDFGEHLSHDSFNFSHLISELSFGPLYPTILNPLDQTLATTRDHFNRFQYYLSIVPTIYTRSSNPSAPASSDTIKTNQYAVTSQSRPVPENMIPGIFFKFDIEPILLTIRESRGGFLALLVRVVNVVSGVLVGGGWMYQLWDWGRDNMSGEGRRRRARSTVGEGMLTGRKEEYDEGIMDIDR